MTSGRSAESHWANHRTLSRALRYVGTGAVVASLTCTTAVVAAFATDVVADPAITSQSDAAALEAPQSDALQSQSAVESGQSAETDLPASEASVNNESAEAEVPEAADAAPVEPRRLIAFGTDEDPEEPVWNRPLTYEEAQAWLNLPEDRIFRGDPLPNNPFRVVGNGPFYCEQGYIYTQQTSGEIKAVLPGSTSEGTRVAPPISGISGALNALAIAGDGSYALGIENDLNFPIYDRWGRPTGQTQVANRFWRYSGGRWTALTVNGSNQLVGTNKNLVAGAISPDGKYYFGYLTRTGSNQPLKFTLISMPVTGGNSTVLGDIHIPTSSTAAGGWNGDMAFDQDGNLFILAANGNDVVLASVSPEQIASNTRPMLAKAQGGGAVNISSGNGIAFRADGSLIISGTGGASSYDPFDFTTMNGISFGGGIHTDSGSCDHPPTLVLQKDVKDGRKEPGDQFRLTVKRTQPELRAGYSPLDAITSGTATGVQTANVGPMPIVVDGSRRYDLSEALQGSGDLTKKYQSEWKCVSIDRAGNQARLSDGKGTGLTLAPTPDLTGKKVVCTIANTPTGSIVWEKRSDDPSKTLLSGSEWTLSSANVTGFTPITVKDCVASNACAGTNDEDPRPGYLKVDFLKDGTYTLVEKTPPTGHKKDTQTRTYTINTDKRDHTAGAITNPRLKASVVVKKSTFKEDGTTREDGARGTWVIDAALTGTTTGLTLKTGEQANVSQTTNTGGTLAQPWNVFFDAANKTASLSLSETAKDGWDAKSLVCTDDANGRTVANVDLSNSKPSGGKYSATVSGLRPDQNVTCEFTNVRTPGTVTWTKVDEDSTSTKLAGSEWELTATGAPTITVRDCVQAGQCAGTNDDDPVAGQFKVSGLLYKGYTLRETAAPDGFKVRTATNAVNVSATNRNIALGSITNSHLTSNIMVEKVTQFADRSTAATAFRGGWEIGATLPTGTPAIVKLTANGAATATQNTQATNGRVPQPWTITYTSSTDVRSLTLSEPVKDGWDPQSLVCVENGAGGKTIAQVDLTNAKAVNGKIQTTITGLRPGVDVTCKFTNAQTRGTVTWDKVAAGTTTRIAGSTWTVTGGPEDLTVTDCTQVGKCVGTNDDDPMPGRIKVSDMLYNRRYTITETKAPTGYTLPANPSQTVTLTYDNRNVTLANVENERLSSTLRLVKVTQHADQTNADTTQRGGWALGATAASGVDIKVNNVVTATQNTNSNGEVPAPWKLLYANDAQRHSVTISEPVKDGWDARSLVCVDTANGNRELANENLTTATASNGRINYTLTNLEPGGNVVCTFTNSKSRGSITWSKVESGTTNVLPGSGWNLNANNFGGATGMNITDCIADGQCAGTNDEDPRPGYFKVSNLLYRNYTLTETAAPAGYKVETASRSVDVNFNNRDHALGAIGNLPLKATVRLVKETRDVDGTTRIDADRGNWVLGAELPTGATNSLKANNKVTATQTTAANGTVAQPWIIRFSNTDPQELSLNEVLKDGWKAKELVCVNADGSQHSRVDLANADATPGKLSATPGPIAPDADITCTFVNQRVGATVTWEKVDKDTPTEHLAGSTWTLTASGAPTVSVTDCTAENACGNLADKDPRPGYFSVTGLKWITYTLTETKAPTGYKPTTATKTAPLSATTRTVDLGAITNAPLKATVTLKKNTVEPGTGRELADERAGWSLGATLAPRPPANSSLTIDEAVVATQDTDANGALPKAWTVAFGQETDRVSVVVSEPQRDGWQPKSLVCVDTKANNAAFHRVDFTNPVANNGRYSVTLPSVAPGQNVSCTFTNEQLFGSVIWSKVDALHVDTLLGGSEWSLAKPDGSSVAITDCATGTTCPADSLDKDPAPGKFRIGQLLMGEYTLTETKAPAGYVLPDDPTHTFTVSAADRDVDLAAIINEQRASVNIPLTGGASADAFLITGMVLMGGSGAAAVMLLRRRRNNQGA